MKQLSIIIVSYNTQKILEKCLSSILIELKDYENCELIIIDNNSTDSTPQYLKEFKEKNNKKIRISLIVNSENLGFAKAVNQGIEISKGEVILLLNSDTLVQKGFFENSMEFEK